MKIPVKPLVDAHWSLHYGPERKFKKVITSKVLALICTKQGSLTVCKIELKGQTYNVYINDRMVRLGDKVLNTEDYFKSLFNLF